MKDLVTQLGLHFMKTGQNFSTLADIAEENGDSESAAVHKVLAMCHLSMAECCVSTAKALEPQITKGDAPEPDLSVFLKIEG